ncbi:MAG: efflux RND transporter periplasmic adaptor subunit [Thermoflexales bacterium]|nr:efflux RND transporter periplasmic adaptor subunit [Thermoflexales bacterium]
MVSGYSLKVSGASRSEADAHVFYQHSQSWVARIPFVLCPCPPLRGGGPLGVVSFVVLMLLGLLAACSSAQADNPLVASGFIEGAQVSIASETSGQIAEMLVDRGDAVHAGDVLLRLDVTVLQNQRLEAEAGLAAANANLARVRAGARPEEIAAVKAALSKAEAERDGAALAVIHAQEAISKPLSLDAEISAAQTQVRLAKQNVEMAKADLAETQLKYNVFAEQGGAVKRTWDLQLQASQAALTQAQAEANGAQRYVNVLLDSRAKPLALQAQLHQAQMQAQLAQAQVDLAQAALDDLEAGSTAEQVDVAQSQVSQALAALHLVDTQIAQLTLIAPLDGIVTARNNQAGEAITAGAPILTIANLDQVTLVVYIPQNRIGQVKVGQVVDVRVDSFPSRVFSGQVASIAGQAEFTPRNVQTQEERVNLVFAVKVHIANPDHALKPGLPADASLR